MEFICIKKLSMRRKNKTPPEINLKVEPDCSENLIKNAEYIKKLELQVMVLNKILDSKTSSKVGNRNGQEGPDSN